MSLFQRGQRLTTFTLIAVLIVASIGQFAVDAAWRGIAPTPPPAAIGIAFSLAVLLVWLYPLGAWVYRAVVAGWRFHSADLAASDPIIFSWGFLTTLIFRVTTPPHIGFGSALASATAAGLVAIWARRFVDGVSVLNVAVGVLVGGLIANVWGRDDAGIRAWLHGAHAHHYLSAIQAGGLEWWRAAASIAAGALTIVALNRTVGPRENRMARPRASAPTFAPSIPPARDGSSGGGFYTQQNAAEVERKRRELRDAEENLKRSQRGDEAEQKLFAMLGPLDAQGWTVERNVFIEGVRIGDVDALVTSPQGLRFAIDAKRRWNCRIVYNPTMSDLTAVRPNGEREETKFISVAIHQATKLRELGYGTIRPVLCFFGSTIECEPNVGGVALVPSEQIVAWLQRSV